VDGSSEYSSFAGFCTHELKDLIKVFPNIRSLHKAPARKSCGVQTFKSKWEFSLLTARSRGPSVKEIPAYVNLDEGLVE
jgi:hypothetical protein